LIAVKAGTAMARQLRRPKEPSMQARIRHPKRIGPPAGGAA
jgi:hypothetical protein